MDVLLLSVCKLVGVLIHTPLCWSVFTAPSRAREDYNFLINVRDIINVKFPLKPCISLPLTLTTFCMERSSKQTHVPPQSVSHFFVPTDAQR